MAAAAWVTLRVTNSRPRRSVGIGPAPASRRDRAHRAPILAVPDLQESLGGEGLNARPLVAKRDEIGGRLDRLDSVAAHHERHLGMQAFVVEKYP